MQTNLISVVQDWPPKEDFAKEFPELYQDFANAVPIPNYTRRDGVLNVAAHFPINPGAVSPDLGPKMYNAFESSEQCGGKGSTRLHMDMADAVNIMLYASDREDGKPGCAVWDIYRAEDSEGIIDFICETFSLQREGNPIHSQQYYLDCDLRKRLFEKKGILSWRIYQKPGDAVFIPAGCAHQVCHSFEVWVGIADGLVLSHQVCNLADCIKVAVDFVSPENIERCEELTRDFRKENRTFAWKEDVLALRQTMFHAWNSLTRLPPSTNSTSEPSTSQTQVPEHADDLDMRS